MVSKSNNAVNVCIRIIIIPIIVFVRVQTFVFTPVCVSVGHLMCKRLRIVCDVRTSSSERVRVGLRTVCQGEGC